MKKDSLLLAAESVSEKWKNKSKSALVKIIEDGLNRFSFKWNIHEPVAIDAINELKYRLNTLLL